MQPDIIAEVVKTIPALAGVLVVVFWGIKALNSSMAAFVAANERMSQAHANLAEISKNHIASLQKELEKLSEIIIDDHRARQSEHMAMLNAIKEMNSR